MLQWILNEQNRWTRITRTPCLLTSSNKTSSDTVIRNFEPKNFQDSTRKNVSDLGRCKCIILSINSTVIERAKNAGM